MDNDIIIRYAEVRDADDIISFNQAMALETENLVLNEALLTSGVRAMLKNKHLGFYLVAQIDEEIIGSLMVTSEWSDWRNGLFWWIQSVYVKPYYRKQGVYRKLYDYVKKSAFNEPNVCGFRLYVEKNNLPAQNTYKALGMNETHYRLWEEINMPEFPLWKRKDNLV
ncbi:MAG: N-acetyltransferase [FCB group bacterium]|jgi:ribosomal protein S18 acetylase RimI-like enzyme